MAAQSYVPELANRHRSIHRLILFKLSRYGLEECLMNALVVYITFKALELVHSAAKGAATPYLKAMIVALALTSLCPLAVDGGSDLSTL